jgi:hypothetical protein
LMDRCFKKICNCSETIRSCERCHDWCLSNETTNWIMEKILPWPHVLWVAEVFQSKCTLEISQKQSGDFHNQCFTIQIASKTPIITTFCGCASELRPRLRARNPEIHIMMPPCHF